MPYVEPSWRRWKGLKWFSRILCIFGRHHCVRSRSLKIDLVCVVCGKQMIGYQEYNNRQQAK